jgi:hypothetical protein
MPYVSAFEKRAEARGKEMGLRQALGSLLELRFGPLPLVGRGTTGQGVSHAAERVDAARARRAKAGGRLPLGRSRRNRGRGSGGQQAGRGFWCRLRFFRHLRPQLLERGFEHSSGLTQPDEELRRVATWPAFPSGWHPVGEAQSARRNRRTPRQAPPPNRHPREGGGPVRARRTGSMPRPSAKPLAQAAGTLWGWD